MNNILARVLVVLGIAAILSGCSAHHLTQAEANRNGNPAVAAPSASAGLASTVGFASRRKLAEHYEKHGTEFGNISIDEYLRVAQTLRDATPGATLIESIRTDGVITRFDRETATFIAFNRDGTILTCFKPNDGEAYFRRQLKRRN
jgi:pyocin large subunit-like protein